MTSLNDLIKLPEPRFLSVLHKVKVVLGAAAVITLLVAIMAALFGGPPLSLFVASGILGFATIVALIANRASERSFVQRAKDAGLSGDEARLFWRTYDWDED